MPSAPTRLKPRKTPVQARAAETRERILEAAARVFSEHGYAAGTTNRIAAAASISVGSLYQYFPNKDSILVELVHRHIDEGSERMREELVRATAGGGPVRITDLIGTLVDVMIANHAGDPGLHQVLFEEAPRPPELLAELHDLEEGIVALAAGLIAADPTVDVADPEVAARLVVATVESLVHRVVATRRHAVDLASFRNELVTLVTRYLAPAPPLPPQRQRQRAAAA